MHRLLEATLDVPFFRPVITETEIDEVAQCLRSGWLTTGPRTAEFEARFARFVGAEHALAVNSCTAALHVAVEALGLKAGEAVLVPTMTFAATAEVVRYQGAVPVLVDCDPATLNMDLEDAERKLHGARSGRLFRGQNVAVRGIIPVHVGGLMLDMGAVNAFASRHRLWVVEDAAHALPAAFRPATDAPWQRCGENTAAVTCYSFYANKTITTGEGGMAVTNDPGLAKHMRRMSLHGLSHDAWTRYHGNGSWDYRILTPGYKYNMTDIAASLGIHQLERAEVMRCQREAISHEYRSALDDLEQLETPPSPPDRRHAWHLFPIRLRLDRLRLGRDAFLDQLRQRKVGSSVHWRPLHLHPYYAKTYGWQPDDLPVASSVWERLISLPLFAGMEPAECQYVVNVVRSLCKENALPPLRRNGNGRPRKPR